VELADSGSYLLDKQKQRCLGENLDDKLEERVRILAMILSRVLIQKPRMEAHICTVKWRGKKRRRQTIPC